MAGFPIGYPVIGAMAGAAWVLASDGTNSRARKAAGFGFVIGAGLGLLKMTAGDVSGLGRLTNPRYTTSYDDGHRHTVNIPRARWNPPRRYV